MHAFDEVIKGHPGHHAASYIIGENWWHSHPSNLHIPNIFGRQIDEKLQYEAQCYLLEH